MANILVAIGISSLRHSLVTINNMHSVRHTWTSKYTGGETENIEKLEATKTTTFSLPGTRKHNHDIRNNYLEW
jgi:hypothetical protein